MGYTTDFIGTFRFDRPLTPAERAYLLAFARIRRVRRDPETAKSLPDPVREAVGLPVGPDGEYFVGVAETAGHPPPGQPGPWCHWVPDETGQYLGWDGREEFSAYVEWLRYLIDRFLAPWGVRVDGRIRYQGERRDDFGTISVQANVVAHEPGVFRLESHTEILRRQPTQLRPQDPPR